MAGNIISALRLLLLHLWENLQKIVKVIAELQKKGRGHRISLRVGQHRWGIFLQRKLAHGGLRQRCLHYLV